MKLIVMMALVGGAAAAKWRSLAPESKHLYTFVDFQAEFGAEDSAKDTFNLNLAKIHAHNADESASWVAGVNAFTAMTTEEFKAHYKGHHTSMSATFPPSKPANLDAHVPTSELPDSLDWRDKGVVTPPKNQGGCGSCWAFSTAETLESHIARQTGKLFTLAPQQIVSCAPNPEDCGGTGGCEGSTQWLGFNYTISAGISTEKAYPYQGRDSKCDTSKIKPVATITGYERLPANNYSALMNAVANIGPIAISASAEPWQLYESGIFSENSADVDHAIQLVGYGSGTSGVFKKTKKDYWLVRNSWGASWGEKGYIRIERLGETSKGEPCQTDKTPQDGTACKGGPKTIQVCGICGLMSDSSYPTGGKLVNEYVTLSQ